MPRSRGIFRVNRSADFEQLLQNLENGELPMGQKHELNFKVSDVREKGFSGCPLDFFKLSSSYNLALRSVDCPCGLGAQQLVSSPTYPGL